MTVHAEARKPARTVARMLLALSLALMGVVVQGGDVEVVVHDGRIDVSAENAPLAQVVEQMAEAIGAQVEYAGPPPDQLVTVAFTNQTPAEVFLSLLEEQRADFAIQTDNAGTGVVKLVIATDTSVSEGRPPPPPPDEEPVPPPAEVLQDVMRQLGMNLEQLESGELGEDEKEPATPELPEALQELLNQLGTTREGDDGRQEPATNPPALELPFPFLPQPPTEGDPPQVP